MVISRPNPLIINLTPRPDLKLLGIYETGIPENANDMGARRK
jgi:hypothetical protein